jgi:serine/threonine protein kinase
LTRIPPKACVVKAQVGLYNLDRGPRSRHRIGIYQITTPIGEGGMGAVHRARDTQLGRDVALKVLPDSFSTDPDRVARFTREAQVLASLDHPNIATIYGLERVGTNQIIVMEMVEGATLEARLAHGPLAIDEARHVGIQIADALDAAHERGIVHRDLKPSNVVIRPDGNVRVLDFGSGSPLLSDARGSRTKLRDATLRRAHWWRSEPSVVQQREMPPKRGLLASSVA